MAGDITKGNGKGRDKEPHYVVVDRRPAYGDGDAQTPAPRHPAFVEELKERAEQAEQRAREISAAYRRIDEERDAFRERLARDLERRVDNARAELLRRVLGIVDDFDRALSAAGGTDTPPAVLEGVGLIREKLLAILVSEGVEEVRTAGQPFDPAVAEAILTEPTEDAARDNIVLEEMEKGYTLGGRLLRPARVKVARLRRPDATPPSGDPPDPA
jgi:molecular chaperone GrpE